MSIQYQVYVSGSSFVDTNFQPFSVHRIENYHDKRLTLHQDHLFCGKFVSMPTWPSRRQPSVDNLRTEVAENVVSAGPIMRLQSIFPTLSPPPVHARHQRSKSHNSVISVDEAAPATAKGHSAKGKSLGSSADKAKSEPVELVRT